MISTSWVKAESAWRLDDDRINRSVLCRQEPPVDSGRSVMGANHMTHAARTVNINMEGYCMKC